MAYLKYFALAAIFVAIVLAAKPNIVFIVADDLGWNELGYQNSTRGLVTPNIDKLATGGIQLKNYYVQPICSPTRSALMTGRYPIRLGTQANVIYWDTPWGIDKSEVFLAENMKEAGYKTALFGKWHLGMYTSDYVPNSRGFDSQVGYYQGCGSYYGHVAAACSEHGTVKNKYLGYDWNTNNTIDITANGTYSAYIIRDRAVEYLEERAKDKDPFFLYLPFQNVHAPMQVDKKYQDLYPDATGDPKILLGMISCLDDMIGDIYAALEKNDLMKNTLIVFTSDNGAPGQGQAAEIRNYPLRGAKTQLWEGGTHVPAFLYSPLLPNPGTISHELYHVTDWLPTLVNLVGGSVSKNKALDGYDIWESLTKGTPSPRTEVLYNINPLCSAGQAGKPKAAIRIGNWKLLSECYDLPNKKTSGHVYLFDLDKDPNEKNDVSAANAAKVAQLTDRLKYYASDMVTPMQWVAPYQGPDYACSTCPLGLVSEPYHAWRPWMKAEN